MRSFWDDYKRHIIAAAGLAVIAIHYFLPEFECHAFAIVGVLAVECI